MGMLPTLLERENRRNNVHACLVARGTVIFKLYKESCLLQ